MVTAIAARSRGVQKSKETTTTATLAPFLGGNVVASVGVYVALSGMGAMLNEALPTFASTVIAATAALSITYGVSYIIGRPLPHPSPNRQVPNWWREAFSPFAMALFYGAGLGFGVATRVPFVGLYVSVLLVVARGSLAVGALAGVAFSLMRVIPLAWYRLQGLSYEDSTFVSQRLEAMRSSVVVVNGATLLLTAVLITGGLLHP